MMIDHAARHLIVTALEDAAGGSVLWVADAPPPDLPACAGWQATRADALLAAPWQRRHDLAIAWLDAALPARQALHLLSALRDLHARQLLVFVPVEAWLAADQGWHEDTLRALGLQQQARFEQDGALREAWSFDIRTYKAVPDWLNPKFWANPENWGKYRW